MENSSVSGFLKKSNFSDCVKNKPVIDQQLSLIENRMSNLESLMEHNKSQRSVIEN